MSNQNVRIITVAKKRKIEDLQKFRDNIAKYSTFSGDKYLKELEEASKNIQEIERNRELKEKFSNNISEINEILEKAQRGDILRKYVIEHMQDFINEIDEQIRNEARIIAKDFLKDAQNHDEIIERVADLILNK